MPDLFYQNNIKGWGPALCAKRPDVAPARPMGAVNRVIPADAVLDQGLRLAQQIAATAAPAVRASKRAINRTYDIMGMRQALLAALETDILISAGGGPV